MFRHNVNKSIFSDKAFQSYSFGLKNNINIFSNHFIQEMKDLMKIPLPQKISGWGPVLGYCRLCLNPSLSISFVY